MNKLIIALILGIVFIGLSGCTNQPWAMKIFVYGDGTTSVAEG